MVSEGSGHCPIDVQYVVYLNKYNFQQGKTAPAPTPSQPQCCSDQSIFLAQLFLTKLNAKCHHWISVIMTSLSLRKDLCSTIVNASHESSCKYK